MAKVKVLVLGGLPQATDLVERLAGNDELHIVYSLAAPGAGAVSGAQALRIGAFNDIEALRGFLLEHAIDLLVDAGGSRNLQQSRAAAGAVGGTGVARLLLRAPPLRPLGDDPWIHAADSTEAAGLIPGLGTRVLLQLEHAELAAFAGLEQAWFAVRCDRPPPPGTRLPAHYELVLDRPPGSAEQEGALLRQLRVDLVVLPDDSASVPATQIEAVRAGSVPLIMVRRVVPPSVTVTDARAAAAWVESMIAARTRR